MRQEITLFLKKYIDEFKLLDIKGVEAIILFGSQARGTARVSSDIDIAIVMEESLTPRLRGMLLSLGEDVDPRFEVNLFFTTQKALDSATKVLNTNTHIKKEGVVLWHQ